MGESVSAGYISSLVNLIHAASIQSGRLTNNQSVKTRGRSSPTVVSVAPNFENADGAIQKEKGRRKVVRSAPYVVQGLLHELSETLKQRLC